jgi:hypothetical protein
MREAGKKLMREEFSPNTIVEGNLAVYPELLWARDPKRN